MIYCFLVWIRFIIIFQLFLSSNYYMVEYDHYPADCVWLSKLLSFMTYDSGFLCCNFAYKNEDYTQFHSFHSTATSKYLAIFMRLSVFLLYLDLLLTRTHVNFRVDWDNWRNVHRAHVCNIFRDKELLTQIHTTSLGQSFIYR